MLVSQAALTFQLVLVHSPFSSDEEEAPKASYDEILAIMMEAMQDCQAAVHALQ